MLLCELFKESPGFDARGPSGTNWPRWYNIPTQMYQQGQRFKKPVSDFNIDALDGTSKLVHVKRIDQRIDGGMTEDEAIRSYSNQIAADVNELTDLYRRSKAELNIS